MTVVDLYTIQFIDDEKRGSYPGATFAALMAEAEENLNQLLPAGYSARIRAWDHADEPTQEDDDE